MTVKRNAEFMKMSLEKAIELYLATEGKKPELHRLGERPAAPDGG